MPSDRLPPCKKVWTTLVTNTKYLPGVLTLNYALKRVQSKYPLVVLYTDKFPKEGHAELDKRNIYKRHVESLNPATHRDYSEDPRFYECWSKLQPFSLTEFDRVVLLDSDMIIVQNMDELMDIPLNPENRVFAASHACICNPFKKPSYPKDWVPENCPFTNYYQYKYNDDWEGPPTNSGVSMCNGGLVVVLPNENNYQKILAALNSSATASYDFSDQSLISDVFRDKWVPLSYKYNALKTLKWIHTDLWKDDEVKVIHYIISPKPWEDVPDSVDITNTFRVWRDIDAERIEKEKSDSNLYKI